MGASCSELPSNISTMVNPHDGNRGVAEPDLGILVGSRSDLLVGFGFGYFSDTLNPAGP